MLNKIVNRNSFYTLFSGLFVAQIINIVGFVVLPKLYTPKDFATFGLYTSFVFILIEIVNWKLDTALQVCDNDEDKNTLLLASFFLAMVMAVIISVPIIYFNPTMHWYFFPIILLFYGINQPIVAFLNSLKQSKKIAFSRIITVLFTLFFSITMVVYFKVENGLIYGFLIGQLATSIYLLLVSKNYFFLNYNHKKIKNTLYSYWKFPTYGVASSLTNTLSKNSIIPLIEIFFGTFFCGIYTMSTRLLMAPASLYQTAMTQSFLQESIGLSNTKLKELVWQTFWFGVLLGALPTVVLAFCSESIFMFIFNAEWQVAGKVTQYLVLWYFVSTIVSPISMVLDIKNLVNKELVWNILLLAFRLGVILIGYFYFDFWTTLLLIVCVGITMNVLLFYYILKILK